MSLHATQSDAVRIARFVSACAAATLSGGLLLGSLAGCNETRAPAAGQMTNDLPAVEGANGTIAGSLESSAAPADAQVEKAATQNITFDTIKFTMEKNADYQRSLITPEIENLEGRNIRLHGFILPTFQQSGLTQFVLVRDNLQCCFGPGAALYDCVVVDMKPGRTTEFTSRPVAVEGKFEIRELLDADGKCLAIYHLDGDAVRF